MGVFSETHLKVGDPAPDFTIPDQDGKPVTLSALKGKRVILYFFPKADTPVERWKQRPSVTKARSSRRTS